jgi:DNA-binding response OmpR family regulator
MRILVVEDESELAEALARGLQRLGYAVDVAADGASALWKADVYEYDLVCLDLNLPDLDGRTVCRRLRERRNTVRVLMLTARDALADRVAGLDDGADDYLVKPFAFQELTARIRALLRRDAGRSGALLRAGDVELDTASHVVRRAGRQVSLTAKEFALLRYFVQHAGAVLSAEHLLEHVWDEFADPFTNTVRVTIANLRRKLGDPSPIETVVGAGYRFRGAA